MRSGEEECDAAARWLKCADDADGICGATTPGFVALIRMAGSALGI